MELLETIVQNSEIPLLSALALGLLTAISPCPLATNITATAYISKKIDSKRKVLLSGILYTLGRMFTYTIIGAIIYFGASKFQIAKLFQSNGEKYLGFVLLFLGLIMLNVIKLNFIKGGNFTEKLSDKFKDKGLLGSFLLGALFAMAFCPYSGALFFGMLMPLTIKSGLLIPVSFSIGTGLPVILFAFVIAFSLEKLGVYFKVITQVEKIMRLVAGITFIITGLYYINIYFKIITF
ncbi:aromatic aminobenezylarsenical efflux permease ArsG family transporter [Myroides odoratimimus]|uniref:aromatic aminobenezylarsenical efflux permease ArsG family transporter n=1 Tax=Myroides odoratimimus TaxID=76832 RepID=UPI0025788210|nr:aromatic aminobenezylarsenical efflux permease ArsG family transporter [Myroides odoratimimus]MDM1039066.1 sulfite exporter TauE/SafE family protein [Myroides odoratimimus]MDM1053194.1 sulfite exporter TauE/SafE family protein [Myroides odoratimimus]